MYDNIRKFLQFQLTVNFVALLTVFLSAASGKEGPLNAVQLLWVRATFLRKNVPFLTKLRAAGELGDGHSGSACLGYRNAVRLSAA